MTEKSIARFLETHSFVCRTADVFPSLVACTAAFEKLVADHEERRGCMSVVSVNSCSEEQVCFPIYICTRDRKSEFKKYFSLPGFHVVNQPRLIEGHGILWDTQYRYTRLTHARKGHSFGASEEWLTSKDALARMVQLAEGLDVPWFARSYRISDPAWDTGSLYNQFPAWAGDFHTRDENKEPNTWIVKPATEARSRGITISNDLDTLLEAVKDHLDNKRIAVVCRYIENPLLFQGCKFDLRYHVALTTIEGERRIFVYDYFIVRRAFEEYTHGADYSNPRRHMTVMQYQYPKEPPGSLTASFVKDACNKSSIISQCHQAIHSLFGIAIRGIEGCAGERVGLPFNPHVCALYGIDIILEQTTRGVVQPVVLECNYKPDLSRLLTERPQFLNHLFSLFFKHEYEAVGRSVLPSVHGQFYLLA